MEYFNIVITISFGIAILILAVLLQIGVRCKKDTDALQKEIDEWKAGKRKILMEQLDIPPAETLTKLQEEIEFLKNKNYRLRSDLQEYKRLYSDEVMKTFVLTSIIKNMENNKNG